MMRSYTLVDPVSCIGSHNSDVIGKYRKCNSFLSNYLAPFPKNSLESIHYSDNMTLGRSNTYIYMCKIATYLFRQAHRLLYSTMYYIMLQIVVLIQGSSSKVLQSKKISLRTSKKEGDSKKEKQIVHAQ